MLHVLARNWWALAIRGVVAILFGILTLAIPGLTVLYLVLLFGAFALLDGIFNIVSAVKGADGRHAWVLVLEGLAGVAAGVMTFVWPGITAVVLLYLIAAWAIVTGVLEVAAGIRLRRHIAQEWLLILIGIASIAFGAVIMVAPAAGALAIVLWIGVYAIFFGGLMLALALRLRSHARGSLHVGSPIMHTR